LKNESKNKLESEWEKQPLKAFCIDEAAACQLQKRGVRTGQAQDALLKRRNAKAR
jgi:hypothetical protein